MYNNYEIGMLGETIAKKYLINNNYIVLEKNFRIKQGEIDLIAIDKNRKELVFTEVKTRTNLKFGKPIEAVNNKKIKNIIKTSKNYIYKKRYENMNIRYDIIEIYLINNKLKINHIKNVF